MKPCETQCQSCGLPLVKDPQGGGTEKDGSKSTTYCSLCYQNGTFVGGDCTVEQMQDIVEKNMKQYGYGRIMRKMARRQIPRLQRRKK